MPAIAVERTIGETKRAVIGGLIRYNEEKMGKQRYRRFAVSLREKKKIVGGVVGEVWMTVLFIQLFWIDQRFRGKDRGNEVDQKDRRRGSPLRCGALLRRYDECFRRRVSTGSAATKAFGSIDGYPRGVTRHWLTKAL